MLVQRQSFKGRLLFGVPLNVKQLFFTEVIDFFVGDIDDDDRLLKGLRRAVPQPARSRR